MPEIFPSSFHFILPCNIMIYKKYIFNINLSIQMIKYIYFSNIFDLSLQFLTHSYQNCWNFLSAESGKGVFCYVIEVTFPKQLRVEPGC